MEILDISLKVGMVPAFEEKAFAMKPGEISTTRKVKIWLSHHQASRSHSPQEKERSRRLQPELTYLWNERIQRSPEEKDRLFTEAKELLKSGSKTHVRELNTDYVASGDDILGIADGKQMSRLSTTVEKGSTGEPVLGANSATA